LEVVSGDLLIHTRIFIRNLFFKSFTNLTIYKGIRMIFIRINVRLDKEESRLLDLLIQLEGIVKVLQICK
jgi:hypothetical protein